MSLLGKRVARSLIIGGGLGLLSLGVAPGATWQMKQRDIHHTGRADYTVPPERLNSSFFDVFLWQKPAPDSPYDGCFGGTSMTFFDGVGPGGADIVVGTYHWPKGIQGMDRHTGTRFWSGNPSGGETIAQITPAFSNDGSTIYVVNDATESEQYPLGHPCMAFWTPEGPGTFRHNGENADPGHLSLQSPVIAPDDRIFLHGYFTEPYAGDDNTLAITEVWAAQTSTWCYRSDPSLYDDDGQLRVVVGTYFSSVKCWDGGDGSELWSVPLEGMIDSPVTIDPENGNIYAACGSASIYVVGLDKEGQALWASPSPMIYEHVPGVNNPQLAQSAGCLSHDGATYYFQTNSEQGEGALYAINTGDGSVKWSHVTGSLGWEMESSSPIVTPNGVVIVGNNRGDAYLAILDEGDQGTVLDAFPVTPSPADQGHACASATLSPEGDLYLPLRTVWMTGNGDGDVPSNDVANVFSAFDLRPDAVAMLPGPPWQAAFALNQAVAVSWRQLADPQGIFDHYAVYRDTAPFSSIEGMTPLATIPDVATLEYLDETAANGTSYYYAVTSVTAEGIEGEVVDPVGPRTPFDETDLQVVSISRTPRYPRYLPWYQQHEVTEPNGFGPYYCSAAMGLDGGQDENTQRWPALGDPVTYTATVRNRGTNAWAGTLTGAWTVDGVPAGSTPQALALAPNATAVFAFVHPWDGASHAIGFSFDLDDARSGNNALAIDTRSVAFMSFIDRTRLEDFREETAGYPQPQTDDFIDWLNDHLARFNELFAEAGSGKRVHYDVLEVIDDYADDPVVEQADFAIFPFRYRAAEGSLRLSGYYDPSEDRDYGLLHECGHQLGLIDIYQNNMSAEQNLVNGEPYWSAECLMNGCSHFLSQHSANAMNHWLDSAHGYFGQYLYCLPEFVKLHFTGITGGPLAGATVTVYQKVERPGLGSVITDQVKAQGVTDENGEWVLPNVPIDPALVPPTYAGDELHANPFGYIHVVGTNALMLLKVEREGFVDYAWLDLLEVNNAYWAGETGTATIEREVALGGEVQLEPPADMAELNAASWEAWSEDGTATASDDTELRMVGEGSVRLTTDGGFDTCLRYPGDRLARWNLSHRIAIHLWCYAQNEHGFQNFSPWIQLHGPDGCIEYHPNDELLNGAIGQWIELVVPMEGDAVWSRTEVGNVSLSDIRGIEIHADTWDYGFSLWVDGVGFEMDPAAADEAAPPLRLALAGNAPNPFAAATELRFALPAAGPIDLAVFDIAGRRVRTLAAGRRDAGVHRLVWDGRDDAGRAAGAGVYFARLRAGDRTLERKMVMR